MFSDSVRLQLPARRRSAAAAARAWLCKKPSRATPGSGSCADRKRKLLSRAPRCATRASGPKSSRSAIAQRSRSPGRSYESKSIVHEVLLILAIEIVGESSQPTQRPVERLRPGVQCVEALWKASIASSALLRGQRRTRSNSRIMIHHLAQRHADVLELSRRDRRFAKEFAGRTGFAHQFQSRRLTFDQLSQPLNRSAGDDFARADNRSPGSGAAR